jgi:hypothetical protein
MGFNSRAIEAFYRLFPAKRQGANDTQRDAIAARAHGFSATTAAAPAKNHLNYA